jgi:hypothetical protein
MAFTLIDGVVANDAFATPASPRTFVLQDGLAHSQFAAGATASDQPVDAVLGLSTWSAGAPGAANVSATLVDASDSVASTVMPVTASASVSALLVDAADTLAASVSVYSSVSAALVDPSDTLSATITPVASSASLSASLVDAADSLSASVQVSSGVAVVITDPQDTLSAGISPVTSSADVSASLQDGGDTLSALLDSGMASFSQEVDLTPLRYYVKRGKQILLFNNAYEADQYIEAQELADKAIEDAQKTSRRARKRLRERVLSVVDVAPVESLELPLLASMVSRYSIPVDLPALIQQEAWDRVMQIHALAMEMQDEEDVELLLLS